MKARKEVTRGPFCPECQHEFRNASGPLVSTGAFAECEGCGEQVRTVADFNETIEKPVRTTHLGIPGMTVLSSKEAMLRDEVSGLRSSLKQIKERLVPSPECGCGGCGANIAKAVRRQWSCKLCGFEGHPVTVSCSCGIVDQGRSVICHPLARNEDCSHGMVVCPVCDSGERSLGRLVVEVVGLINSALGMED